MTPREDDLTTLIETFLAAAGTGDDATSEVPPETLREYVLRDLWRWMDLPWLDGRAPWVGSERRTR